MKALLAKILGISKAVLDFYLPIMKRVFASGAAALLPVALEIVKSLATNGTTGAEKREKAVSLLQSYARQEGISAAESIIRQTIESAVQNMKVEGI